MAYCDQQFGQRYEHGSAPTIERHQVEVVIKLALALDAEADQYVPACLKEADEYDCQ